MPRFIFRLGVCVGFVAFLCATASRPAESQQGKSHDPMTYAERVISIDKGVGDHLLSLEGLLGYPPFVDLASEGGKNIDGCLQFLAGEGHSSHQRDIAILSMHELGVEGYVAFLRGMMSLFDRRLVSRDEISLAVGPTYEFTTVLIENFGQESVRRVLEDIAARDVLPSTKSLIKAILSGEAREQMREFLRDCCSGPGTK
jgi:hypothetical protein